MLRIAVCCGGGFSSSTMASNLERQVKEQGLEDRAEITFIPFGEMVESGVPTAFNSGHSNRQTEVDVALLCPHLEYDAQRVKDQLTIPVYVLPMRLYGQVDAVNFIEEAEDVLELWNQGVPNVIQFPDEPRSMTSMRNVSHRRWLASQGK